MRLTIRFDDHHHTLYADLSSGEETDDISFSSVQGKLQEAGYHHVHLHPKTINELCTNARQGKECSLVLHKVVDATVTVTIGGDNREAYLTLTAADGGQPLTLDRITHAIANAGVTDSLVDQEIVNTCFQRQSVKDICIARATLPIPGKDAVFTPLIESETIAPPDVDDHGVADLKNTHQFLVVDVGTPLMRRIPPTEGEPGIDVTGKTIKPSQGNDPSFSSKLTGAIISPDDPNLLVAAIHGHPIVVKNGVNVDPTLHVDNVDVTTGNITFDGSLEVKGEVTPGMIIDVTGDVVIQGAVDRAAIHAGHNIRIGGGIFGEKETEHSEKKNIEYKIKAGLDIEAKFVHLATMIAEKNIMVKEYISHSHVKSGNHLFVGQDGGKGIVFGGQCEALHRVAINQVGNETNIPTPVIVGQLSEVYQVYHKLQTELSIRSQEAAQLETILQKLQESDPLVLGKTPLDKSQKIHNTILTINEKLARTQELLRALEPEIALQKHAAIEVSRTIYPNVVMTINGTTKRFFEKTPGGTWVQWGKDLLEQGKIEQENKAQLEKKE